LPKAHFASSPAGFQRPREQSTTTRRPQHAESHGPDSAGSHVGPEFHDQPPSRLIYRSKVEVVKLMKMSVDEGTALIKDQSDAGLEKAVLSPFSLDPVRASTLWRSLIEDDGEHYGALAVYYRANDLAPPRTRRQ
jgi:hypothetical protein